MTTELNQIQDLMAQFRRPCPPGAEYQDRLIEEFGIIIDQRFTEYFLKIRRIPVSAGQSWQRECHEHQRLFQAVLILFSSCLSLALLTSAEILPGSSGVVAPASPSTIWLLALMDSYMLGARFLNS